jgi:hypothetical protein
LKGSLIRLQLHRTRCNRTDCLSFASLPCDLYDDATCTIHHHSSSSFEAKLETLARLALQWSKPPDVNACPHTVFMNLSVLRHKPTNLAPLCFVSYPVFMPKPCTHHMHDSGSIVPHIRPKVFTDNQMSWIKYNYYINNVSKDYDDSQVKRNSGRLHNSTGMATGTTRSLELLVKEFQSIFSFWAAGLSSRGK